MSILVQKSINFKSDCYENERKNEKNYTDIELTIICT